jgi:hypothetical protein
MPGMTDPSLDPIFAYLREHSGRFSYSALRDQLLENGYTPADVDRALAIYQQENPPTFTAREWVWPRAILVFFANLLLVPATSTLIRGLTGLSLPILILCAEIVGGIALLSSPQGRVWGRALLFGLMLTIAIPLLLVGICFLILSSGQWH